MTELPDWTRGVVLLGHDGSDYRVLAVDTSGQLYVLTVGEDESGNPRVLACDNAGQLITVLRGQNGNYVNVDSNGYLGVILKAVPDVNIPGSVSVDQNSKDREIQGSDGQTLRTVAVDANGQLIMVPRGQNGNYLAVDSNGYLTTLMKGSYGSDLKTIATDDEGNMIGVLKDTEDQWGHKVSVGIGELAARLGTPISWDRRGQVVQVTTFEDGFSHCAKGTYGTGSAVALDPTFWVYGGYSCKLTAGSVAGAYASVTTYTDFSPASRLGFEVVTSWTSVPKYLYFIFKVWDGTNEYRAQLRYNRDTGYIQFYSGDGTWVTTEPFGQPAVGQAFYSIKGVIDLSVLKWVRMLYNGTEYTWGGKNLWHSAVPSNKYATLTVRAEGDTSGPYDVYVDRMIITTNEPPN